MRIVLDGDTLNCYTDAQVKVIAKTMTKAFELSAENKLLKRQVELHSMRVKQLMGAVDSIEVYITEYREVIQTKDTIIRDLQHAVNLQQKDIRTIKRKAKWKAVGYGLGGFSIGVGVGVLIGVLR